MTYACFLLYFVHAYTCHPRVFMLMASLAYFYIHCMLSDGITGADRENSIKKRFGDQFISQIDHKQDVNVHMYASNTREYLEDPEQD